MLLAIDTATKTASIALYSPEEDTLLAEWTWLARRRHTQDLLKTVRTMLQQLDVSVQALTALAVSTGPGSFTGVRIGISAVKGMGLGLGEMPRVIGLPTLSITAAPWYSMLSSREEVSSRETGPKPRLCAYIQAGRGRFNWIFTPDPLPREIDLWRPAIEDHVAGTVEDFSASVTSLSPSMILLVGEVTAELQSEMSRFSHVTLVDVISSQRRAGQLARLAVAHLAAGRTDSLAQLQPLYLRNP